jgi:hypothetical protein
MLPKLKSKLRKNEKLDCYPKISMENLRKTAKNIRIANKKRG